MLHFLAQLELVPALLAQKLQKEALFGIGQGDQAQVVVVGQFKQLPGCQSSAQFDFFAIFYHLVFNALGKCLLSSRTIAY